MPGEEDFGMTAVEAIASGKAVIALGRGGVREIVPEEGAFFFDSPDEESMEAAVARFELAQVCSSRLQSAAARFSAGEFERKMREVLYRDE
jgi:glycosyltransferase involved in cell wall biosynthesis